LVLNLVILDLYCLGVFGYLDLFGFGIWSMWICLVLEFGIPMWLFGFVIFFVLNLVIWIWLYGYLFVPLCFGFVILYLDLLILYQRAKGPKSIKFFSIKN